MEVSGATCASKGLVTITRFDECQEAARAVDRTFGKSMTLEWSDFPRGCYYDTSVKDTLFANDAHSDDGDIAAQYIAFCKGGSNVWIAKAYEPN